MNEYEMRKAIYTETLKTSVFGIPTLGIYILGIIVGEILISYGQIFSGIGIHTVNLVAIIFAIIFSSKKLEERDILQSLMPVILLRIIALSMPQLFASQLLQYSLIYAIMFIPIYFIIKSQNISSKDLGMDLGIDFRKLYIYLPVGLIIGTVMAMIEYKILRPEPLANVSRLSDVILISMVMFIFLGPVTEIIFRSIIQTRFEKMLSSTYAILMSGSIFGIMYANYGIVSEVAFATIFGIVNGYIFYKTKSLPFIVLINGTTNIMVFCLLSRTLI